MWKHVFICSKKKKHVENNYFNYRATILAFFPSIKKREEKKIIYKEKMTINKWNLELEAVWFSIICVFSLGFQKRNAKEMFINLVFKGWNQTILSHKPRWTDGVNWSHCMVASREIFPISRLNSVGPSTHHKPDSC